MKFMVPIAALALPVVACTAEVSTPPESAAPTETPAATPAALTEHTAQCGCTLESVGHCGNYIQIDGEFVEIANWEEMGLGKMEWCAVKGPVTIQASGTMKDGSFVASAIEPGKR